MSQNLCIVFPPKKRSPLVHDRRSPDSVGTSGQNSSNRSSPSSSSEVFRIHASYYLPLSFINDTGVCSLLRLVHYIRFVAVRSNLGSVPADNPAAVLVLHLRS